jgi:hypothetical protein
LLEPLNESALPKRPVVILAAPVSVPLLPVPERSLTVAPDGSSKPYAATSPGPGGGGGALETVTLTAADVVELPAASRATAVSECVPLLTAVGVHVTP